MKSRRVVISTLAAGLLAAIPATAHAQRCSNGTVRVQGRVDAAKAQNPDAVLEEETLDEECIERNIYLMPGVAGVFFQPGAGLGPFYGGGVQIAPYQWSHNNDRFGPSQGSFYFQAAILQSPRADGALALYEVGGTASFERNSSRRWLVPYFGGTIGGLTHSTLGTSAYAYPMGGVHLYWHRNLMVDAEGGYHFPFEDVDRAKGPRAQLNARFSLW